MTGDSQMIGEMERAGSKDEMQGRAHSKNEVDDTRFYKRGLTNVEENLVDRTTKT